MEELSKRLGKLLTSVELDEAMAAMDKDGDATVDLDEFTIWSHAPKTGVFSRFSAAVEEAECVHRSISYEYQPVYTCLDIHGVMWTDRLDTTWRTSFSSCN